VGFNGEDPYDFIDTNGNLVGEDIDVIKAALAAAGVDVKVEGILGEWTGLIPGLLANRWDVIGAGMFTLPSRCAQAAFANPDYSVGIAMAVKKGNPLNLHSYDDLLANPKVRISASPAGAETIYGKNIGIPDSQFVFSPDTPTCVAALQAGRADVVISEELGLSTVLKKLNDPTIEFVTMSHQPKGSPGYGAMVFRKEDSDLRQLYNTGLAILLSNGQLAAIYDKYGLPHSMLPDPKVTAEQICAGGS
jgi:polar amino acid transport system substrate-binding protein